MSRTLPKEIPIESVEFFIADDHRFVRRIVNECLKAHGIKRFLFAENGRDALKLLSRPDEEMLVSSATELDSTRPDTTREDLSLEKPQIKSVHAHCVITDFNMGSINGLHLLKAIRCGLTGIPRGTPVILLTGHSDDFVVTAALQLDVNAFVIKPVSNLALWEKVQRVLKSSSPLKDAAVYRSVVVPYDGGATAEPDSKPKPEIVQNTGRDENLIALDAVLPGAVLARDLYGARGGLLLREGTVFTLGIIQKLSDLSRINGLDTNIPVRPVPAG